MSDANFSFFSELIFRMLNFVYYSVVYWIPGKLAFSRWLRKINVSCVYMKLKFGELRYERNVLGNPLLFWF